MNKEKLEKANELKLEIDLYKNSLDLVKNSTGITINSNSSYAQIKRTDKHIFGGRNLKSSNITIFMKSFLSAITCELEEKIQKSETEFREL